MRDHRVAEVLFSEDEAGTSSIYIRSKRVSCRHHLAEVGLSTPRSDSKQTEWRRNGELLSRESMFALQPIESLLVLARTQAGKPRRGRAPAVNASYISWPADHRSGRRVDKVGRIIHWGGSRCRTMLRSRIWQERLCRVPEMKEKAR